MSTRARLRSTNRLERDVAHHRAILKALPRTASRERRYRRRIIARLMLELARRQETPAP